MYQGNSNHLPGSGVIFKPNAVPEAHSLNQVSQGAAVCWTVVQIQPSVIIGMVNQRSHIAARAFKTDEHHNYTEMLQM